MESTSSSAEDTPQSQAKISVITLTRRIFFPIVLFSQIWGITILVLAIAWMNKYGGFGWTLANVFNWHPVLMGVSMLYLNGQALLVYRLFRNSRKFTLKLCHATIQFCVLGVASIGLRAAFNSHNWPPKPIPNLYSLHSWVGLGLIIAFGMQLLLGFLIYLLPYAPLRIRITYMPIHRVFGLIMFGLAGATALMGITEKAIFNNTTKTCWVYRNCDDNVADLINWMGISIVLYVSSILYLVATPEYRRVPLATD